MVALENTTFYPAILLHKRWSEAISSGQPEFVTLEEELRRILAHVPLTSPEVSELERWSAGGPGSACPGQGVPWRS